MTKSYPPFLDQIHEHCPRAASIYTRMWREKSEENTLFYEKEKVTNEYSIPWKTLKHDLRLLKKEKVLKFSINSTNDKFTIFLFAIPSQGNERAA